MIDNKGIEVKKITINEINLKFLLKDEFIEKLGEKDFKKFKKK